MSTETEEVTKHIRYERVRDAIWDWMSDAVDEETSTLCAHLAEEDLDKIIAAAAYDDPWTPEDAWRRAWGEVARERDAAIAEQDAIREVLVEALVLLDEHVHTLYEETAIGTVMYTPSDRFRQKAGL